MARHDKNPLYRREALRSLDDIDELDRLVTVTHPRAWLTLAAVALVLAAALAWAFVGHLTITVPGSGILLKGSHTMRVVTTGGGQLTRLLVGLGDRVEAGQAVAEVVSPQAQAAVDVQAADVQRLKAAYDEIAAARPLDEEALAAADAALDAARHVLTRAEDELAGASTVVSPYSGIARSLEAYPGQYLNPGAPIVTVEPTDTPLSATLYLSGEDGKKVKPGQQVQIVPATASVEEYGYLRGRVTFVADLPSTPESMQAVLQNDFLVQEFTAQGAVLRVEAALIPDEGNPSGYAWSSSNGPDTPVSAGTTVTASFVLAHDAPITYVFPQVKQLSGETP